MSKRTFQGVVVKASANKTVVVRVDRTVRHPRYNRVMSRSRTYPVHDEASTAKVGDRVTFVETRPLSKTKHWRLLTETSMRRTAEGKVTPHYDPKMVMQFERYPNDYELWDAYDRVIAPTLCLRGEDSDLLLPDTAEEMRKRGPSAVVVTIAGCGHAPALNVPEQFDLVRRFLNGKS